MAEVLTPAFTPADLVALKELVETDGGASLTMKRAWVPFEGCWSGALPLDVFEELLGSGSQLVSPPRKREALDSVDKVHRDCLFQPKRSRRIQNQTDPRIEESPDPSVVTSVHSVESGLSGASYISFTYVPEDGQYVCRRHYHDGSRKNYGRTTLVESETAPR